MKREEKFDRLQNLFKQLDKVNAERDAIVAEITGMMAIDKKPVGKPVMIKERKPRKQKETAPTQLEKKRGRPKTATRYVCDECGDGFVSEQSLLNAECPSCSSRHISKAP